MFINWKKQAQSDRHCSFPALNSQSQELVSQSRQSYALDLGDDLLEHRRDLSWLLQVAWGIVLRVYTSCDDIVFLYASAGDNGIEMSLFDFELSADSSFSSIFQGADITCNSRTEQSCDEWNRLKYESRGKCNTALVRTVSPERYMNGEAERDLSFQHANDIDIVLQVLRDKNSTSIILDYNTPFLSKEQAVSVAETYRLALSRHLNNPHARLNELDLCSSHDINQLSRWNKALPHQEPMCVHEAILERCLQFPDSPAIDSWDGILTYHELDTLSCCLARRLTALGVGPESFVPICFEKSKWAVVAILGVLRAGGAYTFLDPSSPLSRMISICQDINANMMICSTTYSAIGGKLDLQTVIIPEAKSSSKENGYHQQPIGSSVRPSNAVYVAFTSGSTGKPKGVVVEHASFFLRAMANGSTFSLNNRSRVLQFANYVFDVSNRDILYTLMFGGCICTPSDFDRYNNLAFFTAQKHVNWASLTPSVASLLKPNDVPCLQHLAMCGEPMKPLHISTWADKVNLMNAYGPCETVTVSLVRNQVTASLHPNNIGHGSGSIVWIVDQHDHNKLVPIGTIGELVIESPSIGRGYLNNQIETETSFVPTPSWLQLLHSDSPPGRVYRTGDLGRYEADGSIRFMGRKDAQVKIRGQRVELSEVEHHIERNLPPDTDMAVVVDMIRPRGLEAPLLVAFLSTAQDRNHTNGDVQVTLPEMLSGLEEKLSKSLPTYMIPSAFVPVEKIPMTTTGKKNRRQLRERYGDLELAELRESSSFQGKERGPSSGMERRLQHMWASILGIEANKIKADDSFFGLGGDSITAMRVAALARSGGLDLSVADILEYKWLSKLAGILATRPRIDTVVQSTPFSLADMQVTDNLPADLNALRSKNVIADIVPATESQIFFLTQWSLSSFRFIINGEVDVDRLRAACKDVVLQHGILRTVFTKIGDKFFQIELKDIDVPFDLIQTDEAFETACQSRSYIDLEESPLSGRPLVKLALMSRSKHEHALMVRLSHAQYDGYSSPIFFQSITSSYNDSHDEVTASVPPTTSFTDYVYTCNRHRTNKAFHFWRMNLKGSWMTTLDRPTSCCKEEHTMQIRQGASGNVPTAPQDFTTPTLMNAVFSLVLSQLVQQDDVVFGVVMNTRDIPLNGVETMIGPCININPFRINLQRTTTVLDLCHSLHDQYTQVSRYGYLDLPDIVANSTDWPRQTRLGFMINHLDGEKQPIPLSLDGAPCATSSWTAKIDLPNQVLVRSVTTRDKLNVEVLTSNRVMDAGTASLLARKLVDTAQVFSKKPDMCFSSLDLENLSA